MAGTWFGAAVIFELNQQSKVGMVSGALTLRNCRIGAIYFNLQVQL